MLHLSSISHSEGKRCPKKISLNPSLSNQIKQDQFILFTPKNNTKNKKAILDKWLLDAKAIIIEESSSKNTASKESKSKELKKDSIIINQDQTFSSNDNLQSELNISLDLFKHESSSPHVITSNDFLTDIMDNDIANHIPQSIIATTTNISQSLLIRRKYPHKISSSSQSYINNALLSQRNTMKKKTLMKTLPR